MYPFISYCNVVSSEADRYKNKIGPMLQLELQYSQCTETDQMTLSQPTKKK